MDVDPVLGDVVAVIVGHAVGDARLGPTASHPDGETARVVVPAEVAGAEVALAVVGAAKLAAPYD